MNLIIIFDINFFFLARPVMGTIFLVIIIINNNNNNNKYI